MSDEKGKAALKGQVIQLSGMVDYQDGSVVSREIMRSKAGTVSVFAFDQGEGLSEHTAPFDALVQVLDGSAEVTIGGEPLGLGAGESVIMPAGVPHSLHAPERFKMLLTMIRGESQGD
jgi:quercetin dioxygenase-like cupin family protein